MTVREEGSDMLPTLSKQEIKTLGMLLGLSHTTVMNDYEDSSVNKYSGSHLMSYTSWGMQITFE